MVLFSPAPGRKGVEVGYKSKGVLTHLLSDGMVCRLTLVQRVLKEMKEQSLVIDGNLIGSRTPKDLPDFCKALIQAF